MNTYNIDKMYENYSSEIEKMQKCIDELQQENKELKKQLTTYQILHRDCKVDNLKNISKIEEMENQQKEFIKSLEDMLDNESDIFSVVRIKDVLQNYKQIIGGK